MAVSGDDDEDDDDDVLFLKYLLVRWRWPADVTPLPSDSKQSLALLQDEDIHRRT